MTVSLHGTVILGPGDSARLRTEIGEVSVAREAFAGIPAGEHEGDFVIRRLYLKAATGDSYVLVLPWAELADHKLASAEARGPTPD